MYNINNNFFEILIFLILILNFTKIQIYKINIFNILTNTNMDNLHFDYR